MERVADRIGDRELEEFRLARAVGLARDPLAHRRRVRIGLGADPAPQIRVLDERRRVVRRVIGTEASQDGHVTLEANGRSEIHPGIVAGAAKLQAAGAAARRVASKLVLEIGPRHGKVTPASR